MMFKLLTALLVVSASAFSPAVAGSRVAQSVVAPAAPLAAEPLVARAPALTMMHATEHDADGNPVTHFEMCALASEQEFAVFFLATARRGRDRGRDRCILAMARAGWTRSASSCSSRPSRSS